MRVWNKLGILGIVVFLFCLIFNAREKFKENVRLCGKFPAKLAGLLDFVDNYCGVTETDIYLAIATCILALQVAGALIIFGGYSLIGALYLILGLLLEAPIRYDFYRYKVGEPEFVVLLEGFMQNMSFIGALILFMGIRYKTIISQLKKSDPESETTSVIESPASAPETTLVNERKGPVSEPKTVLATEGKVKKGRRRKK